MAAYAALLSLTHIIEQIQHHPRPPISLDEKHIYSLTRNVTFLQDFLESCLINGGSQGYELESRIAEAAYAAEDVIESHIVDQILAGSNADHEEGEEFSSVDLYHQRLEKVIQVMDLIKREVMGEMKEKEKVGAHEDRLRTSPVSADSSDKSPNPLGHHAMIGFDDVKLDIMNKLAGQSCGRQLIMITGMGGIGKTTLARTVYLDPFIVGYFEARAWATISQEHIAKEILQEILVCLKDKRSRESLCHKSEHELGEILHKSLVGRRYLIVLDDMWSEEAWDNVKKFFPDNNNGSRIMVTTRLSSLACQLTGTSDILKLNFLDRDKSWDLLCKTVFGEENWPIDLEEIGRDIVKNCKGLPLSIVVIGGLLAKSEQTRQHWEYIAENLNSIVNLEDDERCLKVLQTSYNWLPVHLKPCFLYMGVFSEDSLIRVSHLIGLWVAEGFLKPIPGKALEIVAEDYLEELVERNLVLIHSRSFNGKIRTCNMHDLLRDLCLREAHKHQFLCVISKNDLHTQDQGIKPQRRIAIRAGTNPKSVDALQSATVARSLICDFFFQDDIPSLPNFRLLRVLMADRLISQNIIHPVKAILPLVNARFLVIDPNYGWLSRVPSSIHLLWNLQTLIIESVYMLVAPPEIWTLVQLRHIKSDAIFLPAPQEDNGDILDNLHTLSRVTDFMWDEDVAGRIPNLRKLKFYNSKPVGNLGLMHKLESLSCFFYMPDLQSRRELSKSFAFPLSLRELTLRGCHLEWRDLSEKVGSLPFLEVLKLKKQSIVGSEWETVEGQFCNLRALLISTGHELERWTTDRTHFPRLEHLYLKQLGRLMEIPWEIGEIASLELLELNLCTDSANASALMIMEEQKNLGNEGLKVHFVPFFSDVVDFLRRHNGW